MVHDERNDGEITLRTLLKHMQGMRYGLERSIEKLGKDLRKEMGDMEKRLARRIDSIDERLAAIELRDLGTRVMHVEDFVYSGVEPPNITVKTQMVMKEDVIV